MHVLTSYYPVLCVDRGDELVAFLSNELSFETVFASEWYWHLTLRDQPTVNLGLVQASHSSVPEPYRRAVSGVILNLEMKDVATYYESIQSRGWPIMLPLRDEPWGQRHFIVAPPHPGILLDFIEVIAPTAEYAASYA